MFARNKVYDKLCSNLVLNSGYTLNAPNCTELHRVAEPHYSYSYIVTLPKYYSI